QAEDGIRDRNVTGVQTCALPSSLLPATGLVSITRALERGLGAIVSAAAALLVVAEIGVLFAGVCARYVFHRPLIWSDELAGILRSEERRVGEERRWRWSCVRCGG